MFETYKWLGSSSESVGDSKDNTTTYPKVAQTILAHRCTAACPPACWHQYPFEKISGVTKGSNRLSLDKLDNCTFHLTTSNTKQIETLASCEVFVWSEVAKWCKVRTQMWFYGSVLHPLPQVSAKRNCWDTKVVHHSAPPTWLRVEWQGMQWEWPKKQGGLSQSPSSE